MNVPLQSGGRPLRTGETLVPIAASPDIVTARRVVRELACRLGFSALDSTLLACAVSELVRNILHHAKVGEMILAALPDGIRPGIRITALDRGPGIADVSRALEDGYSTCGGLGLGLPGTRRVMDEFKIASRPGGGTSVEASKWMR